jgi:hypothetical protein
MTFCRATSKWHFFPGISNGSSKIRILDIHISLNKAYLEHARVIFYCLQKHLFNNVFHATIKIDLTLVENGFVFEIQIPNLIFNLSFYHNLCISNWNEQCKNTLDIYTSRPSQWYAKGSIWWLFTLLNKALNI